MPDKVVAFSGGEEVECGGDQRADLIEGSGPRRPQEGLQLRKRQFDRIEVRAVGRQEAEVRPDGFDRGADGGLFVGGEVVEDDDIARVERRGEDLLHIGQERRVVDRPVKDRRRPKAVEPQRSDHRVRLPMAARRVIPEARAGRTAPVSPQQVGGHAALVEKDVAADVPQRLPVAPLAARRRDIRPALFVGVYRFF